MMNIGLLGALNRNVQREFDTSRKETIGPAEDLASDVTAPGIHR